MRDLWRFGDSPTLRTVRARWLADRAHLSRATRWSTRLQITSLRASAVPAFCPTPLILVSICVLYIYVHFPLISFCHLKPSRSLSELWFYFLQALSKSECKGKGPWCKCFMIMLTKNLHPEITVTPQMSSACSLMTDNDSDDSVNGGSPRAPPNRQHRKEKKEFPVSLKILHIIISFNMYVRRNSHTSLIFGFSWFLDQNVICGLRVYILYVPCLQLAGWLKPQVWCFFSLVRSKQ